MNSKIEEFFDKKKTTEGLLPIINPLNVECTQLYMLRLTPQGKYDRTELESWLGSITDNWVCAKENSKKLVEHFHCTIYDDLEEDQLREKIRIFLKKHFTDAPKRGDANKQYNLTVATSVEKALNYTVKELQITYGPGMDPLYMDKRIKASFLKFDKGEFSNKLEDLKKNFKESKMTLGDFMISFIQLKALYRQPINIGYAYQLALSCEVNRNPDVAEQYVSDYLNLKSRF